MKRIAKYLVRPRYDASRNSEPATALQLSAGG